MEAFLASLDWSPAKPILASLLAGALIGMERTYNGRPAGFRTHTLVCLASTLLMLVTVYQIKLLPDIPPEIMRIDPTRMAQGIMTGIGFLGAGVIMKESLTVRGLTTAASIWITATIGILIGIGFYLPAVIGTVIVLGTLSIFRKLEDIMPSLHYGRLSVLTSGKLPLSEKELYDVVTGRGCTCTSPSYHLSKEGKYLEYRMTIRTRDRVNYGELARALSKRKKIIEFSITPVGG